MGMKAARQLSMPARGCILHSQHSWRIIGESNIGFEKSFHCSLLCQLHVIDAEIQIQSFDLSGQDKSKQTRSH